MRRYWFFGSGRRGRDAMHIIEIYADRRGEYRFRCKARNGAIIAVSSEGYKDKNDAEHAIRIVRNSRGAVLKDLTEGGDQ